MTLLTTLLLTFFAACSPEDHNNLDPNGVPVASGADVSVSVNQETGEVIFTLNNSDCTPVWIFSDGVSNTVNGFKRVYSQKGEYYVDVRLMNANGISKDKITKTFTIEKTVMDFTLYTTRLTLDDKKTWMIAKDEAGHLGCGPSADEPTAWYCAQANDKQNTGLYDDRFTFYADGTYIYDPGTDGKLFVNQGTTIFKTGETSDFDQAVDKINGTWSFTSEGDKNYLFLSANTFLGYLAFDELYNEPKFLISSLGARKTVLVASNSSIAWQYIIVPAEESSNNTDTDPVVTQITNSAYVPAGYTLAWNQEFNDAAATMPSTTRWSYETGNNNGWGNNELQYYIAGDDGTDKCAEISDGTLKITAKKSSDGTIKSIRMNSKDSWTYGYIEARLKLASGLGAWPAFWMMPKNYTAWPDDGEIDIMEGWFENRVSSAIHCKSYYGGTCKTAQTFDYTDVHTSFHIYALEWTSEYIKTYVDGNLLFTYANDGTNNTSTWPFDAPFYIKLNLAWGGNWYSGDHDDSALPSTYEIDYVRVYQK